MKRARMAMKTNRRNETRTNGLGIRPISEIVHPRSWAIYGRSGSGKTTFAATFPKPVLLLDIRDKGTDSISDVEDVDYKLVESIDDIEDVYYYLKKNQEGYKTVVFDTITQLQQLTLETIVQGKNKNRENVGDWGTVTKREYGDTAAKMKEWIINFRDLPMEVVFIAQERTNRTDDEDENTDRMIIPEVGPGVMPSVAGHLNAAVAFIGNTFIRLQTRTILKGEKKIKKDETRYSLRIGPNPVYTTKIRKPKGIKLPPLLDDPTYNDVIHLMNTGE